MKFKNKDKVPTKHKSLVKKNEMLHIKLVCKSVNGNDFNKEAPKFTGEEPLEVLFMSAKNQFTLNKRHKLLDSEDGIQLAFETASRSLM